MTKKSQTADPSKMSWDKRAAKRFVDEIVFRAMEKDFVGKRKVHHILTLPAADWTWEREFALTFYKTKAVFTGVERDAEVHKGMCKQAKRHNVAHDIHVFNPVLKPIELNQFLLATPQEFDMIYLDWMGTWCEEKFKQLHTLLQRNLVKPGGLMRLTLSLNRGKKDVWAPLCDTSPIITGVQDLRCGGKELPEWKVFGIPGLIVETAANYGYQARLLSNLVYNSRSGALARATPEISMLFRL